MDFKYGLIEIRFMLIGVSVSFFDAVNILNHESSRKYFFNYIDRLLVLCYNINMCVEYWRIISCCHLCTSNHDGGEQL